MVEEQGPENGSLEVPKETACTLNFATTAWNNKTT